MLHCLQKGCTEALETQTESKSNKDNEPGRRGRDRGENASTVHRHRMKDQEGGKKITSLTCLRQDDDDEEKEWLSE